MLNQSQYGTTTRAQLTDSDEAVRRFVVTTRRPDNDVHPNDVTQWLLREESMEIRADLKESGLL